MSRTAVIILNWNGKHFLERFLPSVVRYTTGANSRVVVADNGSEDDSLEFIEKKFPQVEIIRFDKNYGFTGGYNRAIAEIKEADYVLLLNSDVEVTEGYLSPLVDMLDSDSGIAAVQPKILSYDAPDMFEYAGAAGGLIDMFGFPYCRGRIMSRLEKDRGQYDNTEEVFWASGAAMLVRRDLYLKYGGLDEDFFAHMEEIDLSWRFKNEGYRIVAVPKSVVKHVGGGTLPNNSSYKLFLNFRNSLFMLYKNLPSRYIFPIMFTRMLIDGAIGAAYIFQLKFSSFAAVVKAHSAFYRSIKRLNEKRKKITQHRSLPAVGMLRNSMFFLKKI